MFPSFCRIQPKAFTEVSNLLTLWNHVVFYKVHTCKLHSWFFKHHRKKKPHNVLNDFIIFWATLRAILCCLLSLGCMFDWPARVPDVTNSVNSCMYCFFHTFMLPRFPFCCCDKYHHQKQLRRGSGWFQTTGYRSSPRKAV